MEVIPNIMQVVTEYLNLVPDSDRVIIAVIFLLVLIKGK